VATIYTRPEEYDLEHGEGEEDITFYRRLIQRFDAHTIVELGCGSGRITVPLAAMADEHDLHITGVDVSEEMLGEARQKMTRLPTGCRTRVQLVLEDIGRFQTAAPVDLVIVPCSTLAHVLELDEQLAVWRSVARSLRPGGRFVVDLTMPTLAAFADSMATPPRVLVEMDVDQESEDGVHRLIRYKTTRYEAHRQRAHVRFLYDRFETRPDDEARAQRYVSDFESHVYFPRELELLFLHTGFEVEHRWGGYRGEALRPHSRALIMVGRTPEPESPR